jgi:phosphoglycolate phosphatase
LGDNARKAETAYMTASIANSHLLHWFDSVEATLTQLAEGGTKLAIVTSKDRQRTVQIVERLPVSFSTIQSPVQGLRGKPAPDQLLIACAHANVDPSHAFFVGDMPVDQEAARRANIRFCHAAWGYGQVKTDTANILHHMTDILSKVENNT